MAKELTPIRFGRIRRVTVPNVTETAEFDFSLGAREGAIIHSAWLLVEQLILTQGTAYQRESFQVSLHVETEALESSLQAGADEIIRDSEIIAQWSLQVENQAAAVTVGGSASLVVWNGPKMFNYNDMLGRPLLVGQNLTGRFGTTAADTSASAPEIVFAYQIAELTDADLVSLAMRRRA